MRSGKERDSESGLDYFGARYYGSALGRFTSPDWSGLPQPVPYASLENPQSLNLYAYVANNPLSNRDANGHFQESPEAEFEGREWEAFQDEVRRWEEEQLRARSRQWDRNNPRPRVLSGPELEQAKKDFQELLDRAEAHRAGIFSPEEAAIASALKDAGDAVTPNLQGSLPGFPQPDAFVNGIATEFKTVQVDGANTLKNDIQDGLKQAPRVVVDARATVMGKEDALHEIGRAQGNLGQDLSGRVTVITRQGIVRY